MSVASAMPAVVSLFAGAGGGDVGLERAGWRTVMATDSDASCMQTLEASRLAHLPIQRPGTDHHLQGAGFLHADIRELSAKDLRPAGCGSSWRPALLVGGPPCQPWSSAGLQRGFDDDRGLLLNHMIRLTGELQPDYVLFENVRGLVTAVGPTGRPGEVLEHVKTGFEELRYATSFETLNAADFGAPQRRVRLYMLASKRMPLPAFPGATHGKSGGSYEGPNKVKPWVTLREALGLVDAPRPEEIVRPSARRAPELAALVPGTGIRTRGTVETNRPGGHWGYRQDCFLADQDLPSRTIRAATTPDWLRDSDGSHRRLTWRECAALQGFPRGWLFHGTMAARFRQIGNAMQADVVESIGRALLYQWLAGRQGEPPRSIPLPAEFGRRVRYTEAEHRTNGQHRVRVKASVA